MIMQGVDELIPAEFDFFIKGNTSLAKVTAKKPVEWLLDSSWREMQVLVTLSEELKSIPASLAENPDTWKEWYIKNGQWRSHATAKLFQGWFQAVGDGADCLDTNFKAPPQFIGAD